MAGGDRARFLAWMAALPAKVRREIAQELDRQAAALVVAQRAAVPVKKGNLRKSIRAEPTKGRDLAVTVMAGGTLTTKPVRKGQKATYDYALGQEFGNRHAPAQPFFFPTYRSKKRSIRTGVGKAVRKGVKDALRGS